RSFAPMRSNTSPVTERDQIAQQCRNVFNSSGDRVTPILAMATPTLQETEKEARLILESAKSSASDVLGEIKTETDKAKQEIEATLDSVRRATNAIGIEKQAEVFKNAAGEHLQARRVWLRTTIALAVATTFAL